MPMEHKLEIVITNPTTIQSEVPKQQPIRQPSENDSDLKMADENSNIVDENGAKNEDSYVQVFTSKKEEAVLTKGDLKLQKVENITNPNDSAIYSEVIQGPQPLRELNNTSNGVKNCDINLGVIEDKNLLELNGNAENPAEKRPKSRIPRLRQAAERVRQEIRESASKKQKKEVPTPQPRRSSIPRRRRQSYKSPPPAKRETTLNNKENNIEITSDENEGKNNVDIKINEDVTSEDFDKMYEEIIHTDESLPFIDSNVQLLPIVDNLEDPVSLENTFEEMIQDYEDKKVEPINIKEIKSKIPLLKQKSLPEGELIKRLDRRSSLKDAEVNDVKNKDERKSRRSKLNEIKNRIERNSKEDLKEHKRLSKEILKRNDEQFNEKQTKDIKNKYFVDKSGMWRKKSDKTEANKTPLNKNSKDYIKTQSNDQKKKSATIAKPVIRKTREQSTEKYNINDDINEPVTKTDLVLENPQESYQMPESTKIIQNITKEEINKIETDRSQPFLIETTLPAVKREYIETTPADDFPAQNVFDESILISEIKNDSNIDTKKPEHVLHESILKSENENERHTDTEKPETAKSSIPTLRGKVSKLTNKFSSNEQQPVPSPKKTIDHDEVPPKKTILSKIAIFNKYDNKGTEKDKNITNDINKYQTESLKTQKSIFDENNQIKKPKNITETFNTVISKDDLDLYKDIDRPKFARTESAPLGIANRTVLYTLTPPNTPHISLDLESIEEKHQETLKKFESASNRLGVVRDENESNQNLEDALMLRNNYGVVSDETNQKLQDSVKLQNDNESQIALDSKDQNSDGPEILIEDENGSNLDFEPLKPDFEDSKISIVDRQPSFEAINDQLDENDLELKGKVSKIINRIVSVEDRVVNTPPKKEIHIPVKNSVLSRIAMFERQAAANPPKLKEIKSSDRNKQSTKPRIIEEVLKAQPPRSSQEIPRKLETNAKSPDKRDFDQGVAICNNSNINVGAEKNIVDKTTNPEIDILDSNAKSPHKRDFDQGVTISNNGDINVATEKYIVADKTTNHEINILDLEPANESCMKEMGYNRHENHESEAKNLNESNVHAIESEKFDRNLSNNGSYEINEGSPKTVSNNKREKDIADFTKEARQEKVKNYKKEPKLDIVLGKGKVHQLISRMQSLEKLDKDRNDGRKERERGNIFKAKEFPRKKSVSDEIALFEHKITTYDPTTSNPITTFKPNNPNHINTTKFDIKPSDIMKSVNSDPTQDLKYQKRIEDLTAAPSDIMTSVNLDPTQDTAYQKLIEDLAAAKDTYGFTEMEYIELNNGVKMPVLTLGTATLDEVLLPHIIAAAIDLGFRAIDTAYVYGNERQVGEAIRAKIDDGTVSRKDLFIIGKLWSTFHRRDLVEGACKASLEQLGLNYFDLYLIHNPMSFKEGGDAFPKIAKVLQYSNQADYLDAWFGLEGLVAKGLAKSIGVSNFNSEQILRVVEKGKIKPVVNQVECHPYLTQQRLGQFCADRNITLMCYGALGSVGTPKEFRTNTTPVLEDPLVNVMAAGLGVSPAQLLISYQIQNGHPVVTKSSSAARLWQCLQSLKLRLKDNEIDALNSLNRNRRTFDFKEMGETHRNYPFKIAF